MKTYRTLVLSALVALTGLAGIQVRADNVASIAITPATGVVTLAPRWAIGGSLAGFHLMAQDLSLGGGANQFYSIKSTAIPAGGDIAAFTRYIAGSGAATNHADIGSKLTPSSYSALTSADPDVGYGSVNFYLIHHKSSGDYFTVIVPGSASSSAVTDLKPMSGPGGPGTLGASGYFGLTFAASNLGYGLNSFYYLRTDSVTGFTKFGTLDPTLLGTSADKFDLGISGYNALAFTGTDVGFGTDKMYYLRLDPVTGFTIFGTLHPLTGRASDIANLGSVYSTLTFVPGDVGFGSGRFYTTGAVNLTWQSVSFAAIADRAISAGSFTVAPSASSGLAIALTVVSGSTGAASISGPVGGVFTVTPTAPGLIRLQATQAGQTAPIAYESNLLRQSFTASGAATLAITTQPTAQSAVAGTTASFSVTASGTTGLSYQWRKGGSNISNNLSATTATLTLTNVQAADGASYYVLVSNASGSIPSDTVVLTVTAAVGVAPVITNSPLTSAGTVGTLFSFAIAASGSPTSYGATGLPAGLVINSLTGAITGTPTTVGSSTVTLSAANGTGTGTAALTISVGPSISAQPGGTTVAAGGTATFSVVAGGGGTMTYQWRRNGVDLTGATSATLTIGGVQPGSVGYYTVVVSGGGATTTSTPALLEMSFPGKIAGTATEVGTDIRHPNGNIYDQVLLTGAAASVKADAGQVVRVSYVDLTDDIVQVEFAGAGILTVNLENASGPAAAVKYNQPAVAYMKGHASIAITGANDTTSVRIFSVGSITAVDQTLIRSGTIYDGWADLALVTLASADGHFGGVFTANANYFRAAGMTGLYAPGVQLSGPVYVGDINGSGSANAVMVLGSVTDARITGGDLFQDNGGSVEISGMTRLQFTAGTSSGGTLIVPQANRGRLMTNGVNVTAQVVSP